VEFRDNLGVEWALQEAALGATQVAPGQAIDADGRPVEGEAAPSQGAVASWVMGASRKELGQIMTALTEDAKKPYWERRPEPVEGSRMYSGMLQTLYKAGAKYAQRDALLQGFRVLAAIELWRAKQGSAPRALSELVPRYLEALPEDPFTGDDFIYRVEGKGYRLYSTGPDKEDDDGAARIDSKSQQGDLILWPAGPMSAKAG